MTAPIPRGVSTDPRPATRLTRDGEAALAALFDTHKDELRRYAQRFVHSRDTAEDVVQEVFCHLWRVWGRIDVGPGIGRICTRPPGPTRSTSWRVKRGSSARDMVTRNRSGLPMTRQAHLKSKAFSRRTSPRPSGAY